MFAPFSEGDQRRCEEGLESKSVTVSVLVCKKDASGHRRHTFEIERHPG